ncbi:MAG: AAA family ATPase [Calothrix sp. C42_A2020_038]|nr:AAA family ATPase [Calothrix sp. C42_A2020_038]
MVFSATKWEENPYIIGRPIYEPELFFGREELFSFIKDNLNQRVQVILLHGQRRIGKSSVLSQIPNFVKSENFVFVLLSLEGKSQKLLFEVLYELSRDIFDYFDFTHDQVKIPNKTAFQEDNLIFFDNFLPQVYQALGHKNLVLLLDEFDVLGDSHLDSAITHFFPFLLSMISRQQHLYIIPVVGRRLDDMPNLLSLFRQAPTQEIGLLDKMSAERLITKPAEGILIYQPDAIDAIIELSAGHPYFTQVLCFALFSHARELQQPNITRADVHSVINQAIEIGEAGLTWFRDGLPIPERVFFSTVAEIQQQKLASGQISKFSVVQGEALTLLQEHGVVIDEALHKAETRLLEWNFLQSDAEIQQASSYQVTVELVRRWLIKRCPVRREIWELEKIGEQVVSAIYEQATREWQSGNLSVAIELYEQVLTKNPNHFHALFDLAELYFDVGDYHQSVELYTRAFKIDPVRNREAFERARQSCINQQQSDVYIQGNTNKRDIREITQFDLERFYQAFDPSKPLILENALDRKYYIDFASVRGGKIVESLARTITRISPSAPTCQLLTGHIGCGKSTELLRLKAELEQQDFHVVYFESSYFLDMLDVDLIDILLAIVEQVNESLKAINIRFQSTYFVKLFGELNNFLQTPLDLEIEGDLCSAAITSKTKESVNQRRQLREYLEPRTENILQLINQELTNANKQLKAIGKKGLVVIIDNLDRIDIHTLPTGRSQPEHIFIDHSEDLRRLNCHIVYTVPMSLVLSNENALLQNRLGGGVAPRVLSMIPVRHRNGEVNTAGLEMMRQMVLARAFPDTAPVERLNLVKQIFDSQETLDRLCLISGGHVRDILGLVFECLREQDPPFERDTVEAVIRRYRDFRANPIDSHEWNLIFQVLENQHIKDDIGYHTLLNSLFVFEYRDADGSWFTINPILTETKQFQSWLEKRLEINQVI